MFSGNKFAVVTIKPQGYPHADCFDEVAKLLHESFKSLFIDCERSVNQFFRDRVNVILGWHLLNPDNIPTNLSYVVYQLEQALPEMERGELFQGISGEKRYAFLRNAKAVWDWAVPNIEFLKSREIVARHLLPGYHSKLAFSIRKPESPRGFKTDVLFYGSYGIPRRMKILNPLLFAPRLLVKVLFGLYGKERDEWISETEMVLNIHAYEHKIFEAVRASYLWNQSDHVFFLSEKSSYYPYEKVSCATFNYETAFKDMEPFLRDSSIRKEMARSNSQQFEENYLMPKMLKEVLS